MTVASARFHGLRELCDLALPPSTFISRCTGARGDVNRWNYVLMRLLRRSPPSSSSCFWSSLIRLLPGDPASAILGDRATEEWWHASTRRWAGPSRSPSSLAIFVQNFFQRRTGRLHQLQDSGVDPDRQRVPVTIFLAMYAAHWRADCRAAGFCGRRRTAPPPTTPSAQSSRLGFRCPSSSLAWCCSPCWAPS